MMEHEIFKSLGQIDGEGKGNNNDHAIFKSVFIYYFVIPHPLGLTL
jgi:hypothetical protein